ncbi:MAG: Energy-coupling factor transporter ATP-binding protein EcfA1 [Lentilactobacillus parabuchneri]|uniref:ABC transporter ATP-binding protein n=1 Tax=Lentilactobacillus parabuchneri TaxID=152331 RepID=UPI003A5BD2CE
MDEDKRIILNQLSVRYRGSDGLQLRGITVSAEAGQIIGIVGNSHSGKSTLCQVLAGVVPRIISAEMQGSCQVLGRFAKDDWRQYNAMTGVVLQNPAGQLSGLSDTVEDEIAFDLINQGIDEAIIKRRVANMAAQMGLSDQLGQQPESLSGGQMQRLAIATAIVTDPQLLILDDPTSEMDPLGRQQFFDWLANVSNTTVVIVSSELDDLCEVADVIWILKEGQLVANGSPVTVFNHLNSDWQIPEPTIYRLAKGMNWRLSTGAIPVTISQLKEARYVTN